METIAETILEKQRGYLETRFDKLQQMGVEFFLLYPATLKVKAAGRMEIFQSPEKAEDFITSLLTLQAAPSARNDEP